MDVKVVILAAGEGTRMKSSLPKDLHQAAGKSLLQWVADAASVLTEKPVVVYGRGGELLRETCGDAFTYALQEKRLGSGHAAMAALPSVEGSDYTVILAVDMPLIRKETLKKLFDYTLLSGADCTILTASPEVTPAYGRVLRDEKGNVSGIVEDRDASEEEKKIKEVSLSIYCFKTEALAAALSRIRPDNAQKEYYLTDAAAILHGMSKTVRSLPLSDMAECLGVNTRSELARAAKELRRRINHAHMDGGVSLIDPDSTYIDVDCEIGQDTLIYPGVILEGSCRIGAGCTLYQGSRIKDSAVGDGSSVENSVLLSAKVGKNTTVGPNAYLRPGTDVGDNCRIGDFVELKNALIGNGTKISHLTYVGDAELGEDINVGCGVVFVNYDGKDKFITKVGDRAFIGCNTNLISPVNVGAGSYIAAGSTVTIDVPEDALVIARAREVVKAGWAKGRYLVKK